MLPTAQGLGSTMAAAPWPAFFWEHPPLTAARLDEPLECVLLDAPQLAGLRGDPWHLNVLGVELREGIEIVNARLSTRREAYTDYLYSRLQRQGFLHRDCQRLINTDRAAMPGGIGWHPYFHRGDARLTATVAGRIRGAGDPPGARRIPHAPLEAARVDALDLDHGFYGWDGIATLEWPGAGLRLTSQQTLSMDPRGDGPLRSAGRVEPGLAV